MRTKIFYLLFLFLGLNTFGWAQFDPPVLYGNNGTNDINFTTCPSIVPLNFSSNYDFAWEGRKNYIWTLYRNGINIAQVTQEFKYNNCVSACCPAPPPGDPNHCDPCACIPPSVVFSNIPPLSGAYQVRLYVQPWTKLLFVYVQIGAAVYIKYSNVINVTRFDDGLECKCEIPQNSSVSCVPINSGSFFFPWKFRAVHNVDMSCAIHNNRNVTLIAGDKVSLLPGFRSGTGGNTHFRAYLDPCNIIQPPDPAKNADSTIITDTLIESQTTQTAINQNTELNREIQNQDMIIYPNPNNGSFTIKLTDEGELQNINYTIEIYNTLGEKVTQSVIPSGVRNLTIDLSERPKGIYFIKATSRENVFTEKVIVQ
ncbi:MAG: T9SS type A sorting domain-containing protein [Bacteroidetes bacterium]|nr:T9SS type A sorting domain-containing protein [Bacteroidota bacterium]